MPNDRRRLVLSALGLLVAAPRYRSGRLAALTSFAHFIQLPLKSARQGAKRGADALVLLPIGQDSPNGWHEIRRKLTPRTQKGVASRNIIFGKRRTTYVHPHR